MEKSAQEVNHYYNQGYLHGYKDGILKATEILAKLEQVKTTPRSIKLLEEIPPKKGATKWRLKMKPYTSTELI